MTKEEIRNEYREELRKELFDNIVEGSKCKCCDRIATAYPNHLTLSLVKPVIILYQLVKGKVGVFVDKTKIYDIYGKHPNKLGLTANGWGIVERSGNGLPDGNPNDGEYALSQFGSDWLNGNNDDDGNPITLHKTYWTYNDEELPEHLIPDDFVQEHLTISDVFATQRKAPYPNFGFGNYFHYQNDVHFKIYKTNVENYNDFLIKIKKRNGIN